MTCKQGYGRLLVLAGLSVLVVATALPPLSGADDASASSSVDVTPAPVPTGTAADPLTPAGLSDRERARKEAHRPTGVGD